MIPAFVADEIWDFMLEPARSRIHTGGFPGQGDRINQPCSCFLPFLQVGDIVDQSAFSVKHFLD